MENVKNYRKLFYVLGSKNSLKQLSKVNPNSPAQGFFPPHLPPGSSPLGQGCFKIESPLLIGYRYHWLALLNKVRKNLQSQKLNMKILLNEKVKKSRNNAHVSEHCVSFWTKRKFGHFLWEGSVVCLHVVAFSQIKDMDLWMVRNVLNRMRNEMKKCSDFYFSSYHRKLG